MHQNLLIVSRMLHNSERKVVPYSVMHEHCNRLQLCTAMLAACKAVYEVLKGLEKTRACNNQFYVKCVKT